ncbi:MAG TPA: acyl-CoA desaturase [Chitinophagaceae bacterium]|jgi:linoleoyl-CoA desaturase|nr:acyl-CoA desaturase [Chitinophagaceae bacterium]
MQMPKFSASPSNFHADLKKRINTYFDQLGKSTTGNFSLYLKAAILAVGFIGLYVHLVFFTPPAFLAIAECVLLGGVISAIGFNVMHDGGHGSFSKNKFVNRMAAFSLNILGGNSFIWNTKHNIIHHSYTNVDGVDDDIDIQPFLRMSSNQKRLKMHKYQHVYFWGLYAMLYILWIFLLDYNKYFRSRVGEVPLKKMSLMDHINFWFFKLLHAFIFIALPIYMTGVVAWAVGFLVTATVTGLLISIVFQLAHTVEQTSFPLANIDTNKIENEWAIHQINTTANFATHNRLVSWLVGGLNFQIEHHLFPKISHVHYPALSKIIRQACEEHGIKYIEYPRVHLAIASHVTFLKQLGRAS